MVYLHSLEITGLLTEIQNIMLNYNIIPTLSPFMPILLTFDPTLLSFIFTRLSFTSILLSFYPTLLSFISTLLARAIGVPVDRRLGVQLATTLIATINVIISPPPYFFHFWRERAAFQRSAFIEGVLGSKTYLAKVA